MFLTEPKKYISLHNFALMSAQNSTFGSPLQKKGSLVNENTFVEDQVPTSPSPELKMQPITEMIQNMPPSTATGGKERSLVYMSTKIEEALSYLNKDKARGRMDMQSHHSYSQPPQLTVLCEND